MSQRDDYPAGAPCWVDTLQPDPHAAAHFYGALFGWSFDEPAPMPGGNGGHYFIARVDGRMVAGIGQAPDLGSPAVWATHVAVSDLEQSIAAVEHAGGALVTGPGAAEANGRLAVLVDDVGVAFCAWQPGARRGAQLVNVPGTWMMSALHTTSLERARTFYGAVFDWQLEAVPEAPFALWRLPRYEGGEPDQPMPRDVVAVATPTDPDAVPPHWAVNFRVDDTDATANHAVALGGTVLMAPTDTPGFRSAVIGDPQGGVIAVSAPAAR